MAPPQHTAMRVQRLGSMAIVQPVEDGKVSGSSMTVDLTTGSIALSPHPLITEDYTDVQAVLGLMRFYSVSALVLITGSEQVAVLRGSPVYRVTSTEVMTSLTLDDRNDSLLLGLLVEGVDPQGAGRGMYFSPGTEITLTTQRAAALADDAKRAGLPQWAREDLRLFWNRYLAGSLLELGNPELSRFVAPVIVGLVRQLPSVKFEVAGEPREAVFALIARRGASRAGTRYWRRGGDLNGHVANFVETEQLVQFDSHHVASSFVQVRGSMPIMWSQAPNVKYKPPTYVAPLDQSRVPFERHVKSLLTSYTEVTALNLANQHGSEGVLCDAFAALADGYAAERKEAGGFRLVPFDFHKECGATNYARLSVLWDQISSDFARYGYYVTTARGTVLQKGVFRTNCIDSLDRTNVVQGNLARKHLEAHLAKLGALQPGQALADAYPAFDRRFKNMWADHGDEVSNQYAGTGALKSQFTRTGVRDVWGLLDDGKKSAIRYLKNNYRDGEKQDALDLVTGGFRLARGDNPPKMTHQPTVIYMLVLVTLFVGIAVRNVVQALHGVSAQAAAEPIKYMLHKVLFPLGVGIAFGLTLFKFGRRWVNTPHLCPSMVKVWEGAEGTAAAARLAPPADKKRE